MFDVLADNRRDAAKALVDRLARAELPGATDIVSWWTIEAQDKTVDGNDNDAGLVVFSRAAVTQTIVVALAGPTEVAVAAEIEGVLQFLKVGGVVQFTASVLG